MAESLKKESEELDAVIQQVIAEARTEYDIVIKRIEELQAKLQAIEKTDLSENADYQNAKDERDAKVAISNLLLKRIESMSTELGTYTPTGFIMLGTTVELSVITVNGKPPQLPKTNFIFKIVQHNTSNALRNLFAIDSKVGSAILGRAAGDVVDVSAPMGEITYKIERIY